MAYDVHKNFAYSLVATAPSPATSGTSLVVTAGQGTRFPTVPFNATVWPINSMCTPANAEIVRVTNISTDTLTITRAQESSTARSIIVGDQIAATITNKTLTDIEANTITASAPASTFLTVMGIANGETAWSNKGIFDATTPTALGTADPGNSLTAARRNHVHAASFTLSGDITWAENTGLVLVNGLSATGKYCGIVQAGTAGEALAFGEVVYLKASDSRWYKAKADAATNGGGYKLVICVLAAAGAASATTVMLIGNIRYSSFPTLTIGSPVYLSAATAGVVVTSQPSATDNVIRIVGWGNTAAELFFNPSNDYITHT